MKFSEMPYVRPDLAAFQAKGEEIAGRIAQAASADAVVEAYREFDKIQGEVNTALSLA